MERNKTLKLGSTKEGIGGRRMNEEMKKEIDDER